MTTVHRTLVDLADDLTPHQLANVIHEAAYRGRFVEAAVRDSMARVFGRRKLHVLERAIELHHAGSAGTKSARRGRVPDRSASPSRTSTPTCTASKSTSTGPSSGSSSRSTAAGTLIATTPGATAVLRANGYSVLRLAS